MVAADSVAHDDTGLGVRFVVTDHRGHDFEVYYTGILPALFREGEGVLATGRLAPDGVFHAEEIVARHDEDYMPPELEGDRGGGGVGLGWVSGASIVALKWLSVAAKSRRSATHVSALVLSTIPPFRHLHAPRSQRSQRWLTPMRR